MSVKSSEVQKKKKKKVLLNSIHKRNFKEKIAIKINVYVFLDGYAPFLSMTSRDTFLNPGDSVVAAPGPGQYDPVYPQETVRVSGN